VFEKHKEALYLGRTDVLVVRKHPLRESLRLQVGLVPVVEAQKHLLDLVGGAPAYVLLEVDTPGPNQRRVQPPSTKILEKNPKKNSATHLSK
jgi:hypothetical protein